MATAADFNLSASISLQLAAGAAKSLRDQIQKGFTAPLEITGADKAAADAVKKAKKTTAKTPITVPVVFTTVGARSQIDAIKTKIKDLPIDVTFSPSSVKNNLTNTKLVALLRGPLRIPVEVEFGKNTKSAIRKITSEINYLVGEQQRLQGLVSSNIKGLANGPDLTPLIKGGKETKDVEKGVHSLVEEITNLAKVNKSTFGTSKSFGGGFFANSSKEMYGLIKQLNKLTNGKGLDLLEQKFKGLNGKGYENALSSVKLLYKQFTALNDQAKSLQATNKKFGGSFDIRDQLKQIVEARKSMRALFLSMDSADSSTFGISISSQFKKVEQSVVDAKREIRSYAGLLSSLNQKKAGVTASAGRPQTQRNIQDLIDEVQKQKKAGATTDQIKSSAAFQALNAVLGQLKYVDIAAQRAGSSIDAAISKISRGDLKRSVGGRITGLQAAASKIGRDAGAKIAGTTDPKQIEKYKTEAQQSVAELSKRSDDINRQFKRLKNQATIFEKTNFDAAAKSLRGFYREFVRLERSGASIDQIDNAVTRQLAEATNIKGLDTKVNTAIRQIDRLRHSLEFNPTSDSIGARRSLDQLDAELKARTGRFKDLTPDKLSAKVSAGLFDVRAAERFNQSIEATASKLRLIGDANENLGVGKIYTKNADEFERAAARIGSGAGTIGEKLKQLKTLSDNTLIKSKFDAEGGFLGSVAKSAGLATKRLAAFLVLAQGLYTVQSFLTSSLQEALKIDREFVKIEQVFNKDFSGTALEKSLTKVTSQIFTLGKTLGISALEVANAAQILAQAGIYGKDLETILGTVSKSQLGPSFGPASETAEAAIAIFRQFNLTALETQDALGGINRLSAKYAVEAKGITEAVRRAGGIFSSSGDDIASFASAFTLVKQQTREADEAIATGLRNVAQRLQRSNIQEQIKEALGINLVEGGEFVGFQEAIKRIGISLREVAGGGGGEKTPLFAKIRELIGGARQGGRVAPLLQDFDQFGELVGEFKKGANSIDQDVSTAFKSIENKIQRAKSAVIELFTELIRSDLVKFLVEGFTQITIFATQMLKVLNSVPGAIFAIGVAAKALGSSKFIGQALLSQVIPKTTIFGKNKGGILNYNLGSEGGTGLIPGGGPNKDSLLAYLTTGEYVLQRKAVKKYGTTFLDNLNDGTINANKGGPIRRNRGGVIPGYVKGGNVNLPFGSALDDAIEPIAKALKFGAKIIIGTFLGLKRAAESAPPIVGLERTINLPNIQTAKKLTKSQISEKRAKAASTRDFENTFIRFPDKKTTPQIFSERPIAHAEAWQPFSRIPTRSEVDRISLGESRKRSEKVLLEKKLADLDKKSTGPGRYQSSGKNPSIPFSPDKTRHQLAAKNQDLFSELLSKAGINVSKKRLSQIAPGGIEIGNKKLLNKYRLNGYANNSRSNVINGVKPRGIGIRDVGSLDSLDNLSHEFGHLLEEEFSGVVGLLRKESLVSKLPDSLKQSTKRRIENPLGGGQYLKGGKVPHKTLISETFADAVKELASRSTNKKSEARLNPENLGFKQLEETLSNAGVTFNKDNSTVRSRLFESFGSKRERDDSGGKTYIGRNNRFIGPPRPPSYPPFGGGGSAGGRPPNSIIELIRAQGAYKGGAGAIAGASAARAASGAGIGNLIPKGSFLAFGKSLLTTKSGLLGLVTAIVALNGILGEFGGELSGLVLAMASAAFSMYTISRTSTLITAASGKILGLAKGLIATKGKAIAADFAKTNTARVAKATAVKATRTAAGFIPKNPLSAAGLARKQAVAGGRQAILANIRSAGGAPFSGGVSGATKIAAGRAVDLDSVRGASRSAAAVARGAAAKSSTSVAGKVVSRLSTVGTAAKGLFTGLNIAAVAIGAVTGALGYFASAAEKSSVEEVKNAKSLDEAQRAAAKGRAAKSIQGGIKATGKIAGGAILGASVAGPVGAVIGAIGGGLLSVSDLIIKEFASMFPTLTRGIRETGNKIGGFLQNFLDEFYDDIYKLRQNLKSGKASDLGAAATTLSKYSSPAGFLANKLGKKYLGKDETSTGAKNLKLDQESVALQFRVNSLKNKFSDTGTNKLQESITSSELKDLRVKGVATQSVLKQGKKEAKDVKAQKLFQQGDTKAAFEAVGTFKDLSQPAQDAIKEEVQSIADTFNAAGPKNQKTIIAMYDAIGTDIVSLAKEVGVNLDKTKIEAAAAFDELTLFFAQMGKDVEFASARSTGLDAGLNFFSDPSKQSLAPAAIFDLFEQGIDPAILGFGNTFTKSLQNSENLIKQFDPKLAAAADFEITGKRAARNASSAIISGAPNLKDTTAETLQNFITGSFRAATGKPAGDKINQQFDKFIQSKGEELATALDKDGKPNAVVINELFKEFADSLNSGALEEIKRINEITKQYGDQYKQQLEQRFALESEITGLLLNNVDKTKSITDLSNKGAGLTGDALASAEGSQSFGRDILRKNTILQGTGLGGGATVSQLQASLLASQQRQRNAGSLAAAGGGNAGAIALRESEIQAVEAERQNKIKTGLQFIANGTETATHAMAEFERASQKAAASSKFLSDALLGSDDQLKQTVLGVQAFAKVQEAYRKGGTGAARSTLVNLNEDARQALNSKLGSDAEAQAQFNKSIGIGNNINAGPEAAAAKNAITEQTAANNALISGINDSIAPLIANTAAQNQIFVQQFSNTQQILQQADATAKALVNQIAALPEVIKHEGNINLNIIGADVFAAINPAIEKEINRQAVAMFNKFENGLVENNQGLNRSNADIAAAKGVR